MNYRSALSALFSILLFVLFGSPALRANNPVPLLSAASPTAVAPGGAAFALQVQGSEFVPGAVVNWNGSPRTTTFISPIQATVAITAADIATQGTATITITNPAPGGGISNQIFFYIVAPVPATSISFVTTTITDPISATAISNAVEGDFNNDGKLDIAVAFGSTVNVYLGKGGGRFQPAIATSGPAGSNIVQIYVADVNNDGKLDLYAVSGSSSSSTYSLLTFFGRGDGTFQAPVATAFAVESGINLSAFAFADFNGDGVLDAAHTGNGQIVIAYGNADGTFRPGSATALSVPYAATGVLAVGDFRGQGALSLVLELVDTTSSGNQFLGVFDTTAGVPSGNAAAYPEGTSHTQSGRNSIVLADFNGDGKLDIGNMHRGTGFGAQPILEILPNSGSTTQSSFGSPLVISNPNNVQGTLLAADFNGDGIIDLAVGGLIFFGAGNGTFPTSTSAPITSSEDYLVAGDFVGNGRPDIIISQGFPSSLSLGILTQKDHK